VAAQTDGQGDEKGASQYVQGIRSDDCCSSLTILDNVLTVGELSGGEERAGWPHPHSGGLLEGHKGGARNITVAKSAEVLQQ
jgi:hypothetical protein